MTRLSLGFSNKCLLRTSEPPSGRNRAQKKGNICTLVDGHVKQNDSEENLGGRLDCDSNSVFSIGLSESITDLADGAVCKHGPEDFLN